MSISSHDVAFREGETVQGFEFRRVCPLPRMRSVAYELEHVRSGLRVLHVHNDDAENLFSIALRTPPRDDTGIAHILEHSVLCGSRKFPVKDPFVAMTRMSMATFINAMTGSDYTVYPVASNVRRDLFNLADVYWDAVFHPLLTESTFRQEGHHLDFADRRDLESALRVSGVVYNEMKGAYSNPDRFVMQRLLSELFPDTPYGRSSGGDPDAIPDLTYDAFLEFHRRHYRPENAFVFLYGDIPTGDHLEFLEARLDGQEREGFRLELPPQPRWDSPRERTASFASDEATASRTFHHLAWIVGDSTDVRDVLSLAVLGEMLLGNPAAPLHRALVESRLGENLTPSAFFTLGLDSAFLVGIRGSEPERRAAFCELVHETLTRSAQEGFSRARIESAFHQYAYETLEITARYPLETAMHAYAQWIHGGDPLGYLRTEELLESIRTEMLGDASMPGRLIRERLLGNPHRLTQTCRPDPDLRRRREQDHATRLDSYRRTLSRGALERIAEEADRLEEEQSRPSPPEAIATLPQLRVSDLPREPIRIPSAVETLAGGVTGIRNDVFSNGVDYLQLAFDLSGLAPELWEYLPLYGRCVAKMGAAGRDFAATAERVAATTGGVSFSPAAAGHAVDTEAIERRGTFSMKTLDGRMDEALEVFEDLVFELDLRDEKRLRDVVVQERATYRSHVLSSGNVYATRSAARGLGPLGALGYRMYGVLQPRLYRDLAEDFAERREELVARLEAIRDHLRGGARFVFSFTGSTRGYERVREAAGRFAAARPADPPAAVDPRALALEPLAPTGYAVPVDMAFCSLCFPAPHRCVSSAAALEVGGLLLSRGYLWDEVRAKGGAYGVRCEWNGGSKWWTLSSYRDPRVRETLDIFRTLADHVRGECWPSEDVQSSIIGVAKDAMRPVRPDSATGLALWRHLCGETPELREERYRALLDLRPGEVREALLEVLEAGLPQGRSAVVGSRERLGGVADLAVEDLV